jgi:sugar/nucleoside kinase (ribokinase family)
VLTPADLRRDRIESARALLLDAGDPDAAAWAAGVAREAGIPVVLDADTPGPGLDALLRSVDFPLVSRGFAEAFSVTHSARDGLGALVALGARWAVATLGAQGALGRSRERTVESPGFPVEARDTTGAGDAFHGAFVYCLLEGRGIESALRTANAAAALNCRALGAQGGLPDRAGLERFLAAAPGPGRAPG